MHTSSRRLWVRTSLAALAALALPMAAQANSTALTYFGSRADHSAVPTLLSREDRDSAVIGPQALDPQADISYSEAIRDLPPGTIVKQYDIRPQVLVKRGQLVQIVIGQSQGFQIVARVEAMQDGRYGEQIKVKNPESGRILTGVVKGPAMVAGS